MKSNWIKDLLKGLEIATTAATLAASIIEERKPRKKAVPSKAKAKAHAKESVVRSSK